MKTFYLARDKWIDFLDALASDYEVYLPYKIKGKGVVCEFNFKLSTDDYFLEKFSKINKKEIVFNAYRSIEPIRSFFALSKEKLDLSDLGKKVAVFGVKNCDLFSLKIQDFVFLEGESKDPFYEKRRLSTLLICGDCTSFKEACFCLALDINPYPAEGFDLNFSTLEDGFLIDVGSQKAEGVIKKNSNLFISASSEQLSRRREKRNSLVKKLSGHLSYHKIPAKEALQEIVKDGYESDIWQNEAERCVECGACNFACDTCHCFLLAEERFGNVNERVRLWDACLYANFARVAGGANPMKYRYQRLRNRYLKKFDFFPDNLGLNACCGCGRCIDVCPAKIDIRYILRKLNEHHHEKSLSAH